MFMKSDRKLVKVTCRNCGWSEEMFIGKKKTDRLSFSSSESSYISPEENNGIGFVPGRDKAPGKCPECGSGVTVKEIPVVN